MMLVPNPETSPRLYNCLKWFGLVVGCFAKFVTGSLFVFNSYEEALKATFNYTQIEVELQSSLLNVGLGLGFLPGIFYDKFGPTWTSLAGLIVSVGSYLLLWSTTKSVSFYKGNSWLMAVYFFLCAWLNNKWQKNKTGKLLDIPKALFFDLVAGFGSVFTYMVALNTNVINFHTKHRGKIVGLLNVFCVGSPFVFAVVYYNIFAGEGISNVDSFGNFMLCFAATFGVCNLLCVLFLHKYTFHFNQDFEPLLSGNKTEPINSSEKTGSTNTSMEESQPMVIKKLVLNVNYHLFAWMLAFAASVGQVYVNNVTEIATTVFRTIVSVTIGLLSDKFKHKIPRLVVFILGSLFFMLSQIVVLLLADKYVFL
ncbi:hypothetical protein KUTeg_015398 [Tegillarca granosa]|uniref:Nodulin-like domain-containing protein n=1 Tax=Tegillarca granosa TaxID=220873 RepID=A0ABQ9EQ16_TEGGR|nr:hypothetical protein KUTeg_015398 [Tegillarca granosa]